MKLKGFGLLLTGILILALAGPLFIKGPDGRPLMSLDKLREDLLPSHWSDLLPDPVAEGLDVDKRSVHIRRSDDVNGGVGTGGVPSFTNLGPGGEHSPGDASITASTSNGQVSGSGPVMYRWQDEFGDWHFSETPPADVQAQSFAVDTSRTTIMGDEWKVQPASSESEGTGLAMPDHPLSIVRSG